MGLPGVIQKYGGEKMGKFLTNIVEDINPINLDRGTRVQKDPDLYGNVKGIKDLLMNRKDPRTGKKSHGMALSDYFRGKKIGALPSEDPRKPMSFYGYVNKEGDAIRASTRTIGAGAIAAYGLAPMVLGEDNFVSRTIGAGATFGMHAGIVAASLAKPGSLARGETAAMFGVGYGGLAAVNAIRSGNNFGPF